MGDLTSVTIEGASVFARFVSCSFDPKPDITAYELAVLLPYFHGRQMTESDWDSLGEMQRHLKRDGR